MNENRLSSSGEESGPVELKSRDVVQFGVNVNVDKKGSFYLNEAGNHGDVFVYM